MNTTNTKAIDVTWVLLIGLTLAMWWADQSGSSAAAILGIALFKGVLISAIFMGLWRASRSALVLLCVGLVAIVGISLALLVA